MLVGLHTFSEQPSILACSQVFLIFVEMHRTMILNPVGAFLYWQMNYHSEHHMFPAVPFFNLRKLHILLQKDGAPRPNNGLLDTWKEIRMIQRKQRDTPGLAFDAFSRGKEPVYVPQNANDY